MFYISRSVYLLILAGFWLGKYSPLRVSSGMSVLAQGQSYFYPCSHFQVAFLLWSWFTFTHIILRCRAFRPCFLRPCSLFILLLVHFVARCYLGFTPWRGCIRSVSPPFWVFSSLSAAIAPLLWPWGNFGRIDAALVVLPTLLHPCPLVYLATLISCCRPLHRFYLIGGCWCCFLGLCSWAIPIDCIFARLTTSFFC